MKLLRFIQSIHFVLAFFALVLSLCIWYFGPLFGGDENRPLGSVLVRLIVVAAVLLVFGGISLGIFLKRRKQETAMVEEIAESTDTGDL